MRRTTTTITTGALLALLATGCASRSTTDAAPSTTGSDIAASATPTTRPGSTTPTPTTSAGSPRPSSTITPVPGVDDDSGTLPDTCTGLISSGRWDEAFASAPLNDPSVVGSPATTPEDALTPTLQPDGKQLYCVWADPQADTTFLSIRVAVVDSATTYEHLQTALRGYDCTLDGYGYRCQKVSENTRYPVTDGDTYYTRGDVGIHVQQSNTSTNGLLDDVIAHVF